MASPSDERGYAAQLAGMVRLLLRQPFQMPTHPDWEAARRVLLRQLVLIAAAGAALLCLMMIALDASAIGWMPPRGAPGLWPLRIATDFGKDVYVLWGLAGLLLVLVLVAPMTQPGMRTAMQRLAVRVEFLWFAVAVPIAVGTALKWIIGRGRPFVGGKANAFNFQPFQGTEAYYSLPSGHAVTAFALAFGVAALWPQLRIVMAVYAATIAITRLVLLAHHPSDVVAGAVVGLAGAVFVRYWFAIRQSGFVIDSKGKILPT